MARIVIADDSLRLEIDPGLGAAVTDLSLRGSGGAWWPVLRRAASDAARFTDAACYLLAPWSNRVVGAAFEFAGKRRELRPNWDDGSAIHGDVCTRGWRVLDRSPISARLECDLRDGADRNWPWPFIARVRYEVRAGRFEATLSVTNESDEAMPVGLGFHPFFQRVLWDAGDEVRVRMGGVGRFGAEINPPPNPRSHLGGGVGFTASLDDVFAGFDGRAEIEWPASGVRASFECSPEVGHAVVFSPRSPGGGLLPWFCLEPVTMTTDGFNKLARGEPGTGVRLLALGETLTARWAMTLSTT